MDLKTTPERLPPNLFTYKSNESTNKHRKDYPPTVLHIKTQETPHGKRTTYRKWVDPRQQHNRTKRRRHVYIHKKTNVYTQRGGNRATRQELIQEDWENTSDDE